MGPMESTGKTSERFIQSNYAPASIFEIDLIDFLRRPFVFYSR